MFITTSPFSRWIFFLSVVVVTRLSHILSASFHLEELSESPLNSSCQTSLSVLPVFRSTKVLGMVLLPASRTASPPSIPAVIALTASFSESAEPARRVTFPVPGSAAQESGSMVLSTVNRMFPLPSVVMAAAAPVASLM